MNTPLSPCLRRILEFLLYAVLAALMLHATWLTWPDAYIDFSRELYLPWRVSCGDVLYRDLAYYFGPVSVYLNAALFALLGRPSIHALFALNFVFWIATLLTLRAILRRIASPFAATITLASFILLFSFNRYIFSGNFNFLSPYSHELPRGFLFSLLSLLSLDSAIRRRSVLLALLAGFLLGLASFTKPEIILAATSACAVLMVFYRWGHGTPDLWGISPAKPHIVCPFVCGALAALATVLIPLSLSLGSFSQALRDGLLKLYLDCFNPSLSNLPFFKNVLGTDLPLLRAAWVLLGLACFSAPFLAARLILPRLSSCHARHFAIGVLALVAAAVGFFAFDFLNSALVLAPMAFFLCKPYRSPPFTAAFAMFSLLLVSKMFLHTSITFYGFILALPAFCCACLVMFRPPCPSPRAILATACLLGFSSAALSLQHSVLRQGDVSCQVCGNAFLAPRFESLAFNAALDWIRTNTPPDSTLAVLPEGAVLNVLSSRPNPTPYVSIPDTDWPRYDEAAVLAAYSNSPPDTLVLVRKPQYAQFGVDYAQSLMSLLDPLYTPALNLTLSSPDGSIPYLLVATRTKPSTPKP